MFPHAGVRHSPAPDDLPVLLLPGWQNSGEGHWQSLWEQYFGDQRVEQHDWLTPRRGDWLAQLDVAVAEHPGASSAPGRCQADESPSGGGRSPRDRPGGRGKLLLAAHSLGCHLIAAWAAHSQHVGRIAGALLVAPPDTGRDDWSPLLPSWRQPVLQALPFPALLLSSTDDPFDPDGRAGAFAAAWGARHLSLGTRGHLNAASGLGLWPQGRACLRSLLQAR